MEFTKEEVDIIEAHRAKQVAADNVQEELRRRQSIAASIAGLIAEAKTLLQDAKRVAIDNGFEYQIGDMVSEMIDDVSDNQQWYGSDQSHC